MLHRLLAMLLVLPLVPCTDDEREPPTAGSPLASTHPLARATDGGWRGHTPEGFAVELSPGAVADASQVRLSTTERDVRGALGPISRVDTAGAAPSRAMRVSVPTPEGLASMFVLEPQLRVGRAAHHAEQQGRDGDPIGLTGCVLSHVKTPIPPAA